LSEISLFFFCFQIPFFSITFNLFNRICEK